VALHANAAPKQKEKAKLQEANSEGQWSSDHKTLARVETEKWFATPDGANSCLYLNAQPVYPPKHCTPGPKATYRNIHTFLSSPEWSPDGRRVAAVEKVFDWEYLDPFGRYFDGESSDVRYHLVIVGTDGTVAGYPLKEIDEHPQVQWQSNSQLTLNGQSYDLASHPPAPIP
jgi:hypothetical protein